MDTKNPQRYETKETATIEVYGRSLTLRAELKNLSFSGACIVWPPETFSLKPGDLVRMTVHLNSMNRQRNISAEVVWVNGKDNEVRSGVRFIPQAQVVEKITARLNAGV